MDRPSTNEISSSVSDYTCGISPEILEKLKHLDLSGRVTFSENRVVSGGSYGDVSTALYNYEERGSIRVAVKRLRFYLSDDIKLVSLLWFSVCCGGPMNILSSSRKKYMSGRN